MTGISSSMIQQLVGLIDRDRFEVVGITRDPRTLLLKGVQLIQGDLRDASSFAHCLEGCYMVIHGAAITHSRWERAYRQVNLEGTQQLLDAANAHQVERFVFISSNTAALENGAYSQTKWLAEQYIQEKCENWTILRLSEVYGDGKQEGIAELIQNALHKSIMLCPTGMPSKMYPIHVADAVRRMYAGIFTDAQRNLITVINGPEGFSFSEAIEMSSILAKKKVHVIQLSKRTMHFIRFILRLCPFQLGIVPDQIDRLYGRKHLGDRHADEMKLKAYILKCLNA